MTKAQTTQMVRQTSRGTWIKRALLAGLVLATGALFARPGAAATAKRAAKPTAAALEVIDHAAGGKQRVARFVVALGEQGHPSRIEVRTEGATYEIGVRHRAGRDQQLQVELDLRRSVSVRAGKKRHTSSARMMASRKMRVGQRAIFGELAAAAGQHTEVALTLR